jgi:hypothetical protein
MPLFLTIGTSLAEKRLQQLRAPTGQNSRLYFDVMILSRVVQNLHYRPVGPGFRVLRPVNYAADSGVNHSPRTHRARLNCNKQGTAAQAVVAEGGPSLAEGKDLSVSSGVVASDAEIVATRNDLILMDDYSADGNFSSFARALSRTESLFHVEFVHLEFVGHWIKTRD